MAPDQFDCGLEDHLPGGGDVILGGIMKSLSRIWKLYVFYTIVLIAGVTLIGFIVQRQVTKTLEEHLIENAETLAKVAAKGLPDTEDSSVLDASCTDFQKTAAIRLTIISKEGKVMGESDREAIAVEDHLDRPEVREAIKGRVGTAIRYSKSLKAEMLYVALPPDQKGRVLRVAMSMEKVRRFQNEVMILFSLALYLMPILVMVAAFLFAKYRIQDVTRGGRESKGAHS
jgi:two-component system phosphate regulon sensor histidine kinase PhoR